MGNSLRFGVFRGVARVGFLAAMIYVVTCLVVHIAG